jgi:uncharacterized protein
MQIKAGDFPPCLSCCAQKKSGLRGKRYSRVAREFSLRCFVIVFVHDPRSIFDQELRGISMKIPRCVPLVTAIPVWCFAFVIFSMSVHAASFDCRSAKHPNEKLICQSTELSELDDKMVTLFNNVRNLLSNIDRHELEKSQRDWLKNRLDCGDDFICTKEEYTRRIARLNAVLAKLTAQGHFAGAAQQCRVSDPNPPLNIRTTPNGSIVGTLPNGTLVAVLDYSANRLWVFVGRYEDWSPIGWVYGEYLDCKATGNDDSFAPLRGFTAYDCYVLHEFPATSKLPQDPVIATTVYIVSDETRARLRDIEVHHRLQSGVIHKRHEQYREYRTSLKRGEDSITWRWTGILATNRALSMKGEFIAFGEGTQSNFYSEQLTSNGKLDWVGVWSCYEHNFNN